MPATKISGSCCACQKYLGGNKKGTYTSKICMIKIIIKIYKKMYILSCLKYKYYVFMGLTLLMNN